MEVFGSDGTIGVGYDQSLAVSSAEAGGDLTSGPRHWSFMERFLPAYRAELTAFADVARGASGADGRYSFAVAPPITMRYQVSSATDRSVASGIERV